MALLNVLLSAMDQVSPDFRFSYSLFLLFLTSLERSCSLESSFDFLKDLCNCSLFLLLGVNCPASLVSLICGYIPTLVKCMEAKVCIFDEF